MNFQTIGNKRRRLNMESTDVSFGEKNNFFSLGGSNIEVLGNHLYFNTSFTNSSCFKLKMELHKLESKLLARGVTKKDNDSESQAESETDSEKEANLTAVSLFAGLLSGGKKTESLLDYNNGYDPDVIHLHINSPGGSLLDCFDLIDRIAECKVPVYSYVGGMAASAGSLLAVVCDKRFISKNSYILIHQLSSSNRGNFRELSDDQENNVLFMEHIKKIYHKHTNLKGNKLDKLLGRDLFLNAKTCLKYGLVDKIL